ncbi:type II toxin-antitoxin system HicB family antitoxin [Ligilactobacillus equi]|uniref:HicB protein n=2 Tax=Ligilactobacillus equi TaxID=137357 RepID=V7HWC0_9LACO|nr:type II toxin-antitoxin system HicB family antitoxin [Ligilactobacillus equi]ETA74539.1 HicB protein [Ligilactobacillus equi DPC 6820]
MKQKIQYKGYEGSIELSMENGMLFGKVEGLKKSYLPYEGETYEELIEDFHEAVDSYLEICKRKGITPEKSYKGNFNVRIQPKLHAEIADIAISHHKSFNATVQEALQYYADSQSTSKPVANH